MTKKTIIVTVSASFEKKETLLAALKKYAQSSNEQFCFWNEFAFTTEILPECDALLVFNTPAEKIRTICYPEKIVAFMMEPGITTEHPWMFKGLDQYHTIYSPVAQSSNTIGSHGFLGWYFNEDYSSLKKLEVPEKPRMMSCISSGLKQLRGHRQRLNFVRMIQQQFPQIDFFGKGSNFVPDKMDGLLPYRYSIAIENSSRPHYFTEKINDCFLTYTVPVYYGSKNIGQYFPERSFIQIDINKPEQAIKAIHNVLNGDDWQSRLEAVKESRELVLDKYQPLAGAAQAFRKIPSLSQKKEVVLQPVHPGLLKRIKTVLYQLAKPRGKQYK